MNGQNGKTIPVSSWDIGVAMRDLYDLFEKIMYTGVLLGEVALQLKDKSQAGSAHDLQVSGIEWGLPKKQLTAEVISLFKTWGKNPAPIPWILCGPGTPPDNTGEASGSTAIA